VGALSYSEDGAVLFTIFRDGTVEAWQTETGEHEVFLRLREPWSRPFTTPDGKFLLVEGKGGFSVWDLATRRRLGLLAMPLNSQVQPELVFSPDNSVMISVSGGTARAWDTTTWELITKVSIPMRPEPTSVAMSPDASLVTAEYGRGSRRTWNIGTGQRASAPEGKSGSWAASTDNAPDGDFFATETDFGATGLGGTGSGSTGSGSTGSGSTGSDGTGSDDATCVLFCDDGRLIFTGTAKGTVQVWDAATGAPHSTPALEGPGGPVTAIAACWDGSTIATVSDDDLVRVWDTGAGKVVVTLAALPSDGQAAWYPDGSYHVHDRTKSLWWAIGLCRFERGELDPYGPAPRPRGDAG
jgi:WD40 repeat protein